MTRKVTGVLFLTNEPVLSGYFNVYLDTLRNEHFYGWRFNTRKECVDRQAPRKPMQMIQYRIKVTTKGNPER